MEVRIVAQLASCLDELDASGERVVVIGVTSRPETIDQGLRRAGRFEREITIGVPNEEARVDILTKLTKGMRLRPGFPYGELVKCTPGYVGADLQTLCKEASIIAVERVIRSTVENGSGDKDGKLGKEGHEVAKEGEEKKLRDDHVENGVQEEKESEDEEDEKEVDLQ